MLCPKCRAPMPEGTKFCVVCGAPMSMPAGASAGWPTAQPSALQAQQAVSNISNQQYQTRHAQQSVAETRGCVGEAWDDIRRSEGWIGKMFLLGLIAIIPILNFFCVGYAVRSARSVALGEGLPLQNVFEGRNFTVGFFCMVFALVFGLVGAFLGGILGFLGGYTVVWIPPLGIVFFLLIAVLGLLLAIVEYAGYLRIGICDSLGEGFRITELFGAIRKKFGTYIWCIVGPALVSIIPLFVLGIVYIILIFLAGQGVAAGYRGGAGTLTSMVMLLTMIRVVVLVIIGYFAAVVIQFNQVFMFRALGHWAQRYLPEWRNDVMGVFAGNFASYAAPQPQSAPQSQMPPSAAQASYQQPAPAGIDSPTGLLTGITLVRSSGESIRIASFPATLGKGSAADIQIGGNNSISRVHIRLVRENGMFAVEDMHTTNGTSHNGRGVAPGERVMLSDGDVLVLGDERLIVNMR